MAIKKQELETLMELENSNECIDQSANVFLPNPNNYEFVNHKDSNTSNNNLSNLEWCSIEYNNKYRFTNGNASHKGSKSPAATITEEIAIQIYILGHSGKYTEPELTKMFNTTRSVVNKIRLNKTWTHVTNNINKGIIDNFK